MDLYMGKKVLILGATAETIPVVEKAKTLGIETYVVDPFENAPAKRVASHAVNMDGFDTDGLVDLVMRESIDGIILGCADILAASYEEVCRRTGKYCYLNEKVLKVFNNKMGLKEHLLKYGLPVIKEYSEEEIGSDDFKKYPLYIKPVDNNSAKGMGRIESFEEFHTAKKKAQDYSRTKKILIERDMSAVDDFIITIFIINGTLYPILIADRFANSNQNDVGSVTQGIISPSKYTKIYFEHVHDKLQKMTSDLYYDNGFLVIQGFVENNDIMFYDPCLRFMNGTQEYVFFKELFGEDVLLAFIHYALYGNFSTIDITKFDWTFDGKSVCDLAFSSEGGTIGSIVGLDYASQNAHVINITQKHFVGDYIDNIGTLNQNFCRMHIVADSVDEMRSVIADLQDRVRVLDIDGRDITLAGMDAEKWFQ